MGQSNSIFSEDELEDYKDLTYLTIKEILHVYKKFKSLDPVNISKDKCHRIPEEDVIKGLPELRANPFAHRICKIFSSADDHMLSFEDFLDMMSVFSSNAPKTVKTEYAFRIFDFDEDDMIGRRDIQELLNKLTDKIAPEKKLTREDINTITNHIMLEADLDEDDHLAFAEFEHAISKSPDFMNCFRIRL